MSDEVAWLSSTFTINGEYVILGIDVLACKTDLDLTRNVIRIHYRSVALKWDCKPKVPGESAWLCVLAE
jgi:hypothetical protein